MSNICPHCFGASVTGTNVKSSRGPLSKTLCRPINPAQVCTALVLPSSSLHYCPQSELDRKTRWVRFVLLYFWSQTIHFLSCVLVLVNQNRQQVCIKSLQISFTDIPCPSSIFRDKALFLSEVWGQWLALARPRGGGGAHSASVSVVPPCQHNRDNNNYFRGMRALHELCHHFWEYLAILPFSSHAIICHLANPLIHLKWRYLWRLKRPSVDNRSVTIPSRATDQTWKDLATQPVDQLMAQFTLFIGLDVHIDRQG